MDEKKKLGRPSKFKPEYCQMLIDHMASGLSFESFAAVIKVNQDTLHEWTKVHSIFSESKTEAWSQNLLFWEKLGIDHIINKTDSETIAGVGGSSKSRSLNSTIWIFNMKNRFPDKWRDKKEIDSNSTLNLTEQQANIVGTLAEKSAAFLGKKK